MKEVEVDCLTVENSMKKMFLLTILSSFSFSSYAATKSVLHDIRILRRDLSTQARFVFSGPAIMPKQSLKNLRLTLHFPFSQLGDIDHQKIRTDLLASGLVEGIVIKDLSHKKGGVIITIFFAKGKVLLKKELVYFVGTQELLLEFYSQEALFRIKRLSDGPLFLSLALPCQQHFLVEFGYTVS